MNGELADAKPLSLDERVLWHCIVWTYAYYALGALYVLAPAVGWSLLVAKARRGGLVEVPAAVWVWVAGMLGMLLALVVAHADFNLGAGPMVKSSIGWAKGWGLIAVFMVIGCSSVRLEVVARAVCLLGVQTLCLLPLLVLAWAAGLPAHLYDSPVGVVGGPGPEYFSVELYAMSPDSGLPRWQLFAPWAPATGMVMCASVLIAWNERHPVLRGAGIAGMLLAILLSSSRLGLLALPVTLGVAWALRNLASPRLYFVGAPLSLAAGVLAQSIIDLAEAATSMFNGARADSSRVRAMLGRIAVDRWQREAPAWGHGSVERGPHLVEYMPIGSHHTWYGLLFVKGVAGVLSLAVPIAWSIAALVRNGARTPAGGTALALVLLLLLYTFAENLEILAYLYWPALAVIGLGLREEAAAARRPAVQTHEARA